MQVWNIKFSRDEILDIMYFYSKNVFVVHTAINNIRNVQVQSAM